MEILKNVINIFFHTKFKQRCIPDAITFTLSPCRQFCTALFGKIHSLNHFPLIDKTNKIKSSQFLCIWISKQFFKEINGHYVPAMRNQYLRPREVDLTLHPSFQFLNCRKDLFSFIHLFKSFHVPCSLKTTPIDNPDESEIFFRFFAVSLVTKERFV